MNYHNVTGEAAGRFRERYACLGAEEPDVGAIKWLKDGKKLLVAAAVPPRSSCADKRALWGYVVEIPSGKVLDEIEAKKLTEDWGEFLGYPDLADRAADELYTLNLLEGRRKGGPSSVPVPSGVHEAPPLVLNPPE